jgi:selenocysteine lyase/cysteine desulfurase
MLGPMTAGIFYVKKSRMEELKPSLLGAWNVECPNFIASEKVEFVPGGRRYEPGVLNSQGLVGMKASMDLLTEIGIDAVSARLLELKKQLCDGLDAVGLDLIGPVSGPVSSGITSCTDRNHRGFIEQAYRKLLDAKVVASFRHDRDGVPFLRFSPHFYNTHAEIERVLEILKAARA